MNSTLSKILQQQKFLHRVCDAPSQVHFLCISASALIPRVDAWDISAQLWVYPPAQFCCPRLLFDPTIGCLQESAEVVDYLITLWRETSQPSWNLSVSGIPASSKIHLLPDGPSLPPCHITLWSQISTTEQLQLDFLLRRSNCLMKGAF